MSLAFALALVLSFGAGYAGSAPPRDRAELTNPFLGPEYSAWLIGPIALLATPEEISAFQALTSDEQARAFVEAFWAKREGASGSSVRDVLEERAAVADRTFTENGIPGRRTDRGTVLILYGPPKKIFYEADNLLAKEKPMIEGWIYDEGTPEGLDGQRPESVYRFAMRRGLTVFYAPDGPEQRLRRRHRLDPVEEIR
ncbi:MAG TPA: GWxTD domain-containing protein [Thermoanaerobaculia bacterium]|nr:GWxTD domain-containing protein [Thermoanaerobaculia bacterium]